MAQIKQIPGCTDAGVLRNVTNKLNAYTELQGRIAALGDNVEPAARAANLQLLKFAAMAVGHEVAAGNRNTEQGTKWSPYRCKPKKHKGATGTAKVTKANSRQSGADVEVVFYAFSPVSSGDSSLMIYSNQFGDLEAPRVRMSPVHGLSPNSPIVSGSVRIPANSIKPEWTYCLALAQGDVWIREKGTQDCIIALRRFEAAGNRPRVNVWCSSPYPMFPFSELDHELASQVRIHERASEAAETILNEIEQAVLSGHLTLSDSSVLFEMASQSLNSAVCNSVCYLAKLSNLAGNIVLSFRGTSRSRSIQEHFSQQWSLKHRDRKEDAEWLPCLLQRHEDPLFRFQTRIRGIIPNPVGGVQKFRVSSERVKIPPS
jgi:hypothetical protein